MTTNIKIIVAMIPTPPTFIFKDSHQPRARSLTTTFVSDDKEIFFNESAKCL